MLPASQSAEVCRVCTAAEARSSSQQPSGGAARPEHRSCRKLCPGQHAGDWSVDEAFTDSAPCESTGVEGCGRQC
jgi:hypothetical protein